MGFEVITLGGILPVLAPYFWSCSLTNLSYMKDAPLNWGSTSHATNATFTWYQNGILNPCIKNIIIINYNIICMLINI